MKDPRWKEKTGKTRKLLTSYKDNWSHERRNALYDPKSGGNNPVQSVDWKTSYIEKSTTMDLWAEHSNIYLNCLFSMFGEALDVIPQIADYTRTKLNTIIRNDSN